MNARQFDGLAKTLSSGANRRGVLGLLGSGVVATLGGRGSVLAHHKPPHHKHIHCAKTRCKDYSVYLEHFVPCDLGPGTGCMCVLSVEGCRACVDENFCLDPCTSSAQCVTTYGPGAVCQQPNSGACGQTCMKPCPV